MLNRFDLELEQALERRREDLANADRDRLAAACTEDHSLTRRMARPLGRALFHLGARLMTYADARPTVTVLPAYQPSSRTIELN